MKTLKSKPLLISFPLPFSITQVAQILGISRTNAYELIHIAGFPKIQLGKRIVIPKDKLLEWLNRQIK